MVRKLGVLCTHPIQYYAPLFRHLASDPSLDTTVYYCRRPTSKEQGEGFGVSFDWDVDLTSGYKHVWLENQVRSSDLLDFYGYDTPEITDIIAKERFDAFLVFGWHTRSMWQAMRACWKIGTPLLVRGDSHLRVPISRFKRLAKEISHRYFIPRFSACLAVGRWSEEYFAYYGARRIVRSPHFVDNDWFAGESLKAKSLRSGFRESFGIPEEATVFLFAGKFEEKKRPMDLLWALKRLIEGGVSRMEMRLLMVGDGILKPSCEQFAKTHDLPAAFTGFLNQTAMPMAYAASDVLVLPSDGRETWGLVVNEAMACGLPAVASDKAGCGPDLVKEGETGFIFPCGDTEALAGKMDRLTRGSLAGTMGRNCSQRIADYSVERAACGILDAVRWCENGGKRRASNGA